MSGSRVARGEQVGESGQRRLSGQSRLSCGGADAPITFYDSAAVPLLQTDNLSHFFAVSVMRHEQAALKK